MKLVTHFGEIRIFADGIPLDYTAVPYISSIKSVRESPPKACYKISVPAENLQKIRCIVDFNENIPNTGSSDERYLCAEFIRDNFILAIGAEDENPCFDTVRLADGMEYSVKSAVENVIFTVVWTDDYKGRYDIRASLAADIF